MKKLSKSDRQYLKILDAEAEYIAKTSGGQCNEPFITPVLFSLIDSLTLVSIIFSALLGSLLLQIFIG